VYAAQKEIYWDSYQIRFKVPAEHQISNKAYDMEIQILHKDYYNRAQFCKNKVGAFSLFFTNTGKTNDFFSWTSDPENSSIDLGKILAKDTALHN
jgi:carbonic anhydrase